MISEATNVCARETFCLLLCELVILVVLGKRVRVDESILKARDMNISHPEPIHKVYDIYLRFANKQLVAV